MGFHNFLRLRNRFLPQERPRASRALEAVAPLDDVPFGEFTLGAKGPVLPTSLRPPPPPDHLPSLQAAAARLDAGFTLNPAQGINRTPSAIRFSQALDPQAAAGEPGRREITLDEFALQPSVVGPIRASEALLQGSTVVDARNGVVRLPNIQRALGGRELQEVPDSADVPAAGLAPNIVRPQELPAPRLRGLGAVSALLARPEVQRGLGQFALAFGQGDPTSPATILGNAAIEGAQGALISQAIQDIEAGRPLSELNLNGLPPDAVNQVMQSYLALENQKLIQAKFLVESEQLGIRNELLSRQIDLEEAALDLREFLGSEDLNIRKVQQWLDSVIAGERLNIEERRTDIAEEGIDVDRERIDAQRDIAKERNATDITVALIRANASATGAASGLQSHVRDAILNETATAFFQDAQNQLDPGIRNAAQLLNAIRNEAGEIQPEALRNILTNDPALLNEFQAIQSEYIQAALQGIDPVAYTQIRKTQSVGIPGAVEVNSREDVARLGAGAFVTAGESLDLPGIEAGATYQVIQGANGLTLRRVR